MTDSAVYRNALPEGAELMEYRLDAVLGAGGFGLTYLAWDAHLHKQVAVKEYLPADIALRALDGSIVPIATQRNEDYRWGLERFLQEARTLARCSHPHVVRVLRYFEANNTAYMVMDYEHGESLSRLLKREPYPSEERLRAILLPVLDGLRAVHEAGFLHRDIKPSNIFLREQGGPVLLDFGAARHTVGGSGNYTAVVTPGYAPIEQYSAQQPQGPWSDIYAVAGVFYRAVTNENPPDAVGRMRRDTVAAGLCAARARYSDALLTAIGWGLETEEQRRPQSVAEWQDGLLGRTRVPYQLREPSSDDQAGGRAAHAPAAPRGSRPRHAGRKAYRWAVPLAAAIVLLMVWRAYDRGRPETHVPPSNSAMSPPAAAVRDTPPGEPAAVQSSPAQAPPATRNSPPRRKTPPAERPRTAASGVTEAERPAEDGRAPVRDAVALPPIVDAARERPDRERTVRPGRER